MISHTCQHCGGHVLFETRPIEWECETCGYLNGYNNKELMKRNDAGESLGSIEATLEERGNRYGAFIDQATIAQSLKIIINSAKLPEHYMSESVDMICNKLARIANGDPYYDDSWRDIAGYAQLVVDILEKESK